MCSLTVECVLLGGAAAEAGVDTGRGVHAAWHAQTRARAHDV